MGGGGCEGLGSHRLLDFGAVAGSSRAAGFGGVQESERCGRVGLKRAAGELRMRVRETGVSEIVAGTDEDVNNQR